MRTHPFVLMLFVVGLVAMYYLGGIIMCESGGGRVIDGECQEYEVLYVCEYKDDFHLVSLYNVPVYNYSFNISEGKNESRDEE